MCGDLFLPWSEANARALGDGSEEYEVQLQGRSWSQKPVKYQAKSLVEIRKKYDAVAAKPPLDEILEATHCLSWLR